MARSFPNKYAADCTECGQQVKVATGLSRRNPDENARSKWLTSHKPGECPTTGADATTTPADAQRAYPPTAEQAEGLRLVAMRENVVMQAGAGTGKTSWLLFVADWAKANDLTVAYRAFNRRIVDDTARKAPGSMGCKTMHSDALAALPHYRPRLSGGAEYVYRQNGAQQANLLGIDPFTIPVGNETRTLAAGWIASRVMGAVRTYCRSADDTPGRQHIAYIDGIDPADAAGNRTYANNDRLADYMLPFVEAAWADLSAEHGNLRFSHDVYLKVWSLGDPIIQGDILAIDEAQDTDAVQMVVVRKQIARGMQVIGVGDESQCQPTGTMVSVVVERSKGSRWTGRSSSVVRQVPIEDVREGDLVVSYNVSRRYVHRNGQRVTAVDQRSFHGDLISIETATGQTSRYTPEHRCVARFGDRLMGKHVVYVMRRGSDYRVGVTGGRVVSQGKRLGLVMRAGTEGADAAWILSVHDTRSEALEAEAVAAWMYGVPDVGFTAGNRGMSQDGFDRFWAKAGGNFAAAEALLDAHGRSSSYPLWRRNQYLQTRRAFATEACNLVDGMEVLPLNAPMLTDGHAVTFRSWSPITVSRENYEGTVHSLAVEGDHTYVADGIFTHNCIYEWRGAVNALAEFEEQGAKVTFLTQSFRFGDAVAEVANGLLGRLGARLRLRGHGPVASTVGPVVEPDAILCRTNAGAVRALLSQMGQGRKAALLGNSEEIAGFMRGAIALQDGRRSDNPELAVFDSWTAVEEYVDTEPEGKDLKLMVKLVNEFGAERILDAVNGQADPDKADVVCSTGHKTKGLEWNRVQIGSDFKAPAERGADLSEPELRLAYVACTRAKLELDLTNAPHLAPGWSPS